MLTSSETVEKLRGWFAGRLPQDWFEGAPEVLLDREEITIIGRIPAPSVADDASDAERVAACAGRVKGFREETRGARIAIAREAERRFGRKVAWGVDCGDVRELFTTLSIPVMTRLRQPERRILDTLVDAAWRARGAGLVRQARGQHADAWLDDLRDAMQHVERVRAAGPGTGSA